VVHSNCLRFLVRMLLLYVESLPNSTTFPSLGRSPFGLRLTFWKQDKDVFTSLGRSPSDLRLTFWIHDRDIACAVVLL